VRLRWDRVRGGLTGLAVVVLAAGVVVAGAHGGYPTERPHLLSGSAWLASSGVGELTLLDGSSAEVAAQVRVADPGDRLGVVQQSATAYAVDGTDGTVRRIDGATFQVSPPATPVPGAGDGLHVFAGAEALYALDAGRGILAATDPATLVVRGRTVPLAVQVNATDAALDDAGRLWVLDAATGDLIWIEHGTPHTRRGVAHPGGQLVLADGAPVVVDLAARTATVFDPGSGSPRTTIGLDLRPGDTVAVSGSAHGARLYLAASRGTLAICDLTSTGCATALPLGTGTHDFGPPVETGGRLFVPDYTTGQVWVVDLTGPRVLASPRVLGPRTPFQLLTRDGVVFFNDPDSEHAGVVTLDGGIRPVAKYDPADPGKGLGDQPTTPPTPPTPQTPHTPSGTPTPGATDGVRIVTSTTTPVIGQDVVLKVVGTGAPAPVAAQWSFGDGHTAPGTSTTHHWDAAQTYQVSVQARFPDGRTATAWVRIQVAGKQARLTVTVSGAGTVTGTGVNCPPSCGTTTAAGQSVTLTAVPTAGFALTGWGGACAGTARTCTVTMTGDVTVSAAFGPYNPVVLPAPVLLGPADGTVLFDLPRDTAVRWQAVAGATRYRMQAEINQNGTWGTAADTTVGATGTTFRFGGDKPGRWRVTAIAPDGTPGTPSGWATFSYDTRIQAFAGTWVTTTSPGLGSLRQVTFQPTSPTSGNLQVTGTCEGDPGLFACTWSTGTATLSGGNLVTAPLIGPSGHYTQHKPVYRTYQISVSGQMLVQAFTSPQPVSGPVSPLGTLVKG